MYEVLCCFNFSCGFSLLWMLTLPPPKFPVMHLNPQRTLYECKMSFSLSFSLCLYLCLYLTLSHSLSTLLELLSLLLFHLFYLSSILLFLPHTHLPFPSPLSFMLTLLYSHTTLFLCLSSGSQHCSVPAPALISH